VTSLILHKVNKIQQYFISILLVCSISLICFFLSPYIGYRVIALLLLVSVSFIAMFFDILPVLLAATLSALIWDYFFIPPRFTFAVNDAEDLLLLLMYFVIALVNVALTVKIRQIEKVARQKDELANTTKLYNTVLNSISHELRIPVTTIIGAADNLMVQENKLSEQNKKDLLWEIIVASFRMEHQVVNLLNMSRIESGLLQLNKDWVDINELLHTVVYKLKDYTKNHPVNILIPDDLPLVRIDYGCMEQVILNLLYNAVIFIPKYCLITIRAVWVNDKLIIKVEDSGEGFPEDQIEKVFDKFYKLNNKGTGGMGLGLSIVKGFVEAHNGTVSLENIPDGGSRFTIIIPAESTHLKDLINEQNRNPSN
jgi:two-component system, OmpR family, sensor histidine kinase KdpD